MSKTIGSQKFDNHAENLPSCSASQKKRRITASMLFFEEEPVYSDSDDEKEYIERIRASFGTTYSSPPKKKQEIGIQCDTFTENKIPWKILLSLIRKCSDIETGHDNISELIDLCKTLNHKFTDIETTTCHSEFFEAIKVSRGSLDENFADTGKTPAQFQPSRYGNCMQRSEDSLEETYEVINPGDLVTTEHYGIKTPVLPAPRKAQFHQVNRSQTSTRIRQIPTKRYSEGSVVSNFSNKNWTNKVRKLKQIVSETGMMNSTSNGRDLDTVPVNKLSRTSESLEISMRKSTRDTKSPPRRYLPCVEVLPTDAEVSKKKNGDTSFDKVPVNQISRTSESLEISMRKSTKDTKSPPRRYLPCVEVLPTDAEVSKKKNGDTSFDKENTHFKISLPQRLVRPLARNWMKSNANRSFHVNEVKAQDRMFVSLQNNHKVRRLYSPTEWLLSEKFKNFAEKQTS